MEDGLSKNRGVAALHSVAKCGRRPRGCPFEWTLFCVGEKQALTDEKLRALTGKTWSGQ